jgi:hypothetical protein
MIYVLRTHLRLQSLFLSHRDLIVLVKVSAAVGAVLGLADAAMHSRICSVTSVCTMHVCTCSICTYSVCIYSAYKHVAPTFSDRHQSSTIDLLLFNR